jgi:isocitrate dehydrogenase
MTQLNNNIAKQLANKIEAYDATLDTQESQIADLLHFTKQHHVDREHVAYAITKFVANKYRVALNDKGQLVKATEGKAKEAWNAARKRKQRLMAAIYAEPKPAATRNKVDPLELEAKRLRAKYTAKQLKALFASLGV